MNQSIYTKKKTVKPSFFMSMTGLNVIDVTGVDRGFGTGVGTGFGTGVDRGGGTGFGTGSRDIHMMSVRSGGGNMFQVVSGKSCGACPSK